MKKIIFIDLDGTLIDTHSGETFPNGIWDMNIKWDAWKALKSFVKENNTKFVCIVTNQGGIEKGYVNKCRWLDKFRYIKSALHEYLNHGNDLDIKVFGDYCTSNNVNDVYRKPNTRMLFEFFYRPYCDGITKDQCLMIGDASGKPNDFSDSDKKTAENFGIEYIDIEEFIKDIKI